MEHKTPARTSPVAIEACSVAADPGSLLEGVLAVGGRLAKLAYRGDDFACWAGLFSVEKHWSVGIVEFPFYDANSGIAFFLGYLGEITGQSQWVELARGAATASRFVARELMAHQPQSVSVGAFRGWGGQIYMLSHVGSLWNEPALLHEAEQIVRILPPLIEATSCLDVDNGLAGCLAALMSLHCVKPSEATWKAVLRCQEKLLASPRNQDLERVAAVENKLATGFGVNHSLANGDLRSLELLFEASHRLHDPALRETTYRLAAGVLENIKNGGWKCGVPLGAETPGLMNGLAGIGYGLLRLAAPDRVPSVLNLSSPLCCRKSSLIFSTPSPASSQVEGGKKQQTLSRVEPDALATGRPQYRIRRARDLWPPHHNETQTII